jgi:tetratricopeptide (TPR) repeat protein
MKNYYVLLLGVTAFACQQHQTSPTLPTIKALESQFSMKMDQYRKSRNIKPVLHYIDSLRKNAELVNSRQHQVLLYRLRAFAANTVREMEVAGRYLDSARSLLGTDSSWQYEKMQLSATTAEYLFLKNDLEKALQYLQESYLMSKKRFPEMTDRYRAMMIDCFVNVMDTANAMKYAREMLTTGADPIYADHSYSVIGYIFSLREQDDSSMHYMKKANLSNATLPPSEKLTRMLNAGQMLYMDGNQKQARAYIKICYEYAHEQKLMDPFIYRIYAQCKFEQGKRLEGLMLLDSGIQIGIQQKKYADVSDLHIDKAHLLSAAATARAVQLMDSAIAYKSQADSVANRQAIQELGTKFEVKEKDEHIKYLREKEAAVTKIKQLQTVVILSGVAFAILAAFHLRTQGRRRKMDLRIKELKLLQRIRRSQIDSHFWISSLTAIQGEIEDGKNKSALFYLKRFARLATVNMRNSSHDKTSLADELEGIVSYLELQKAIHEGKFDFTIANEIDMEQRQIVITTMLLQPFVENAVVHGMAGKHSGGKITIHLREENEMVVCTIEDNGEGLSRRATQEGKPSASTAITEDRLQIISKLSGRGASLKVEEITHPGNGVRVTVRIPYMEGWQETTAIRNSA